MADDSSTRDRARSLASLTGSKWRDKLKDKAARLAKGSRASSPTPSSENDVSDFLRPSSSHSVSPPRQSSQPAFAYDDKRPSPSPLAVSVSEPTDDERLDPAGFVTIGSNPPNTTTATTTTAATTSSISPPAAVAKAALPLPKIAFPSAIKKPNSKPKNVHVDFTSGEPDIIGEGGDECEIPSKHVKGSWDQPENVRQRSASRETGEGSRERQPVSLRSPTDELMIPGFDDGLNSATLHRAPTRKPVGGWVQKRNSMNMEEGLVKAHRDISIGSQQGEVLGSQMRTAPVDSRQDDGGEPAKDRSATTEDGPPKLETVVSPVTSSILDGEEHTVSPEDIKSPASSSFIPYNPSIPTAAPASNQMAKGLSFSDRTRKETSVPDAKRTATAPANIRLPPNMTRKEPNLSPYKNSFEPPPESPPAAPPPVGQSMDDSMENGHDESDDFYSRVQHLRGVFRLAAEKCEDIEAKAVEHWLRASSWWFLQGKQMIENNIRSMSRSSTNESKVSVMSTGSGVPIQTLQGYVNLAKAWWIEEEMVPDRLSWSEAAMTVRGSKAGDSIDGLDHAQLVEVHKELQSNMQSFAEFLKQRNMLPPPALLIQGADPIIWIESEPLPPGIYALAAGLDPRTLTRRGKRPFFPILLSDTPRHFSYGRVFGEVELVGRDGTVDGEHPPLPSIISIIRERTSSRAEITITSQDGQINVHIQWDRRAGGSSGGAATTWQDVEWRTKSHSMRIRLGADVQLAVRMWEQDFKTLWGIHDYIHRVEVDWEPREHERLVFDEQISLFQYVPPQPGPSSAPAAGSSASGFPTSGIKRCALRLYETRRTFNQGSTRRNIFEGHRLAAITPPTIKTLSILSLDFSAGQPLLFSNLRGEDNAPAFLIGARPGADARKPKSSAVLTFKDVTKRAELHAAMMLRARSHDEASSKEIPLESMWVVAAGGAGGSGGSAVPMQKADANGATPNVSAAGGSSYSSSVNSRRMEISKLAQWQGVKVINLGPDPAASPIVLSDRLRISASCDYGNVTDLVNLGTGELRISLDVADNTVIRLYRPPQGNLIVSFAENLMPREEVANLEKTVATATAAPSARAYKFRNLSALHDFQALATGFSVLYDCRATCFSIARRRSMVPIYKRLEATLARLQIVSSQQQHRSNNLGSMAGGGGVGIGAVTVFQLLVVLEDFGPGGRCMNWVLKETDTVESYQRSGKHFVRFVDAKFAWPKLPEKSGSGSGSGSNGSAAAAEQEEGGWDYMCLDMPEYPSEHEDILVGFDTEEERDAFGKSLPAGLTKVSRMTSFRK